MRLIQISLSHSVHAKTQLHKDVLTDKAGKVIVTRMLAGFEPVRTSLVRLGLLKVRCDITELTM